MNQSGKPASPRGVLYGIAAYTSWGLFPLYFHAVAGVPAVEVLAHRAIWSFVMLAAIVGLLGRWREIARELRNGKLALMLAVSTLFIAANWLLFIYATTHGHVLQASLGYFINPLANVVLGVAFLRERLRPLQGLAIALAVAGVIGFALVVGEPPWIALALALTFSLYGLMRKLMPVDGLVSLTVETLAMAPFGLAYLVYLAASGYREPRGLGIFGLLILSGPITTVPLLFFGAAARRLRLSTMGFLQFIAPTLQFLLAVLAFGEKLKPGQLGSFAAIWAAVAIYAFDSLTAVREYRIEVVEPD